MIEVVTERQPNIDRYQGTVLVRSVNAVGEERRYEVSLTDDVLNGRSILAGKRVDEHDYDRDTPDAPTSAVYDAARNWFKSADGFDVKDN